MLNQADYEVLKRAQQGDMMAFAMLRDQYEQRLRRFIQRLIGRTGQEDDVLQDVFLALYLNLERIDPPEKLLPFLFRVARNNCYDMLRKRERRQLDSLDAWEDNLPGEHLPVEEKAHWQLLYREVHTAIQHLPDIHRQTMLLYIEEHLSYAEIAEVMNVEIGTVKSRMYHARKLLRGLLDPDIVNILTMNSMR